MDASPATAKLHQEGKLRQRCPACGLVEAAGGYCTKCLTKTGPAGYFQDTSRTASATAARTAPGPIQRSQTGAGVESTPQGIRAASDGTLGLF